MDLPSYKMVIFHSYVSLPEGMPIVPYCPIPDFSAQGLPDSQGGPEISIKRPPAEEETAPERPKARGLGRSGSEPRLCIKKNEEKGWASEKSTRNSPNKLDGQIGHIYKNG